MFYDMLLIIKINSEPTLFIIRQENEEEDSDIILQRPDTAVWGCGRTIKLAYEDLLKSEREHKDIKKELKRINRERFDVG